MSQNGDAQQLATIAITRKFLIYQLWTARYCLAVVVTDDRELGFGSGEGAVEKRLPVLRRAAGAKLTQC